MANFKKCQFAVDQIEYLGHIISSDGVAADPTKIAAMVKWPAPKNVKELRGFLGLPGYYRKFVANYGSIALPLTQLLKKGKFQWNETAEKAFQQLKSAMMSVPVLGIPDFTQGFVLKTDASGVGIGAVLMQHQRPVAFFSQALPITHRFKAVYERKLMAIVRAVQKWRPHLLGKPFVVRTDKKSLKFLLEQRAIGGEYHRWITKLLGYDFVIEYKKGMENKAADALSRLPPLFELGLISVVGRLNPLIFIDQVTGNEALNSIRLSLINGQPTPEGYSLQGEVLCYHGRLVLPEDSPTIPLLLAEFHNCPIG